MMDKGKDVCIIDIEDDDDGVEANLGFSNPNTNYEYLHKSLLSDIEQLGQQQRVEKAPVLGLKLTKSRTLIDLLEDELNSSHRKKMRTEGNEDIVRNSSGEIRMTHNDFVSPQMSEKSKASDHFVSPQTSGNSQGINNSYQISQTFSPPAERLKASNFPIHSLQIGNWKRYAINEAEMVAKCYYAKKKLVWEVLIGRLKHKMEILWSDIIGIRAHMPRKEFGILEIELDRAPVFYRETALQPRRHTMWLSASDFTGGQALKCRRHTATFDPGYLDKNYEKLLHCDKNLFMLSQKPFPSQPNPYFPDAHKYFGFDGYAPRGRVPSTNQYAPRGWVPSTNQYASRGRVPRTNQYTPRGRVSSTNQYAPRSQVPSTNQGYNSNAPVMASQQHISENQIVDWNQGLGNGFDLSGNRTGTLFENTSSIITNARNVGYQPPLLANFGNTSPIVSTNTDSGVYQPQFGNTSPIVPANTDSGVYRPQFENTSPIIPSNLHSIGNNIGYQPNHIDTDDGLFGLLDFSSNVGNNMDYGSHNHGDFEVFPQLSYPSSNENQEPLHLVQGYELPYQHLLAPQSSQGYDNSSLIMMTDSTLGIGDPCQGHNDPPVSVIANPTTLDASQPHHSTSLAASASQPCPGYENPTSGVEVANTPALDISDYIQDPDNLTFDVIGDVGEDVAMKLSEN